MAEVVYKIFVLVQFSASGFGLNFVSKPNILFERYRC